jgi:hypothetical protein
MSDLDVSRLRCARDVSIWFIRKDRHSEGDMSVWISWYAVLCVMNVSPKNTNNPDRDRLL